MNRAERRKHLAIFKTVDEILLKMPAEKQVIDDLPTQKQREMAKLGIFAELKKGMDEHARRN